MATTRKLILTFHDIFMLDGNELGCKSAIEHKIHIDDSEPFKEHFRHIPLLILDEVHTLLRDMLDVGVICPSQSPWCNVVLLVQKKDGTLHFAWISTGLMGLKRTCAPCCRYRKHWRVWWVLHVFQQWISRVGFGKSGWHLSPNSIPPSQGEIWGFMSSLVCPLGSAMSPQPSNASCRTYCVIYLDDVIVFGCMEEKH